jgi:hypothetical protein
VQVLWRCIGQRHTPEAHGAGADFELLRPSKTRCEHLGKVGRSSTERKQVSGTEPDQDSVADSLKRRGPYVHGAGADTGLRDPGRLGAGTLGMSGPEAHRAGTDVGLNARQRLCATE